MRTEIISILDASSSMSRLIDETIKGYNAFIEEQKKVPGECNVTLHLFSTTPWEPSYVSTPLQEVQPIDRKVYFTGGWTALLDTIGMAIDEAGKRFAAMPKDKQPEKVIVQIVTDGAENYSMKYDNKKIREMIKHQEDVYKWEFIFLGANQDSFAVAGDLGFKTSNISNYSPTLLGTDSAYRGLVAKSASLRSGRSAEALNLASVVQLDS